MAWRTIFFPLLTIAVLPAIAHAQTSGGVIPQKQIRIVGANADAAAAVLDGKEGTIWSASPLPQELVLELPEAVTVTSLRYVHGNGVASNYLTRYSIFTSTDGQTWQSASALGTLSNISAYWEIRISGQRLAKYVKLVYMAAQGSSASTAEINVVSREVIVPPPPAQCTTPSSGSTGKDSGVIFIETWDDGNGLDGWLNQGGCMPYNFTIVDDPLGPSNKVMRVENRVFNRQQTSCRFAGASGGPKRARVELYREKLSERQVALNEDFWMSFRVYVHSDLLDAKRNNFITVSQLIGPSGRGVFDPDFKLRLEQEDTWYMEGPGTMLGGEPPVKRGQWTNVVIHYKRSAGSDGLAQLWLDGKLVKNGRGKSTLDSTVKQAGWRFGIYTTENLSETRPYLIYFDDIKIAKGPNAFLAGGSACSPASPSKPSQAPAPRPSRLLNPAP